MLLSELINKLQDLYAFYEESEGDYMKIMGEPEVVIDVFKNGKYQGFSKNIVLSKTEDGAYNIISAKETLEELTKNGT